MGLKPGHQEKAAEDIFPAALVKEFTNGVDLVAIHAAKWRARAQLILGPVWVLYGDDKLPKAVALAAPGDDLVLPARHVYDGMMWAVRLGVNLVVVYGKQSVVFSLGDLDGVRGSLSPYVSDMGLTIDLEPAARQFERKKK